MDGRTAAEPIESNGSVGNDEVTGPASPGNPDEPARFPLTIREVVRRGRKELDEVLRLRAEVDELRTRAESAEHLLGNRPDGAEPGTRRVVLHNGHGAHNGKTSTNGKLPTNGRVRAAPATSNGRGWALAAVLPGANDD